MHAVQALSLLALAGSAVAAPGWGFSNYFHGGPHNHDAAVAAFSASPTAATDVVVVTAVTTVTADSDDSQPTESATNTYIPIETPAAAYTPTEAVTTTRSPKAKGSHAAATATATSSSGASTGTGYMSVVSEWRSKMGLSALTQSSTLEANALKTAVDGNGEMKHELNPGSMAQVLAPGSATEFEHVFVGGWLCEVPTLAGLDGICNTMSAGWSYGGQTGHADILHSASYSKIGCALADGIWACDLA